MKENIKKKKIYLEQAFFNINYNFIQLVLFIFNTLFFFFFYLEGIFIIKQYRKSNKNSLKLQK